nr:MAG TPA: hypothetical protein [Bacteriophage sp.]
MPYPVFWASLIGSVDAYSLAFCFRGALSQALILSVIVSNHRVREVATSYLSGYSVVCRWLTAFQPWQIIMSGQVHKSPHRWIVNLPVSLSFHVPALMY